MAFSQKCKLMKWQVYYEAGGQNGMLTKWKVDQLAW